MQHLGPISTTKAVAAYLKVQSNWERCRSSNHSMPNSASFSAWQQLHPLSPAALQDLDTCLPPRAQPPFHLLVTIATCVSTRHVGAERPGLTGSPPGRHQCPHPGPGGAQWHRAADSRVRGWTLNPTLLFLGGRGPGPTPQASARARPTWDLPGFTALESDILKSQHHRGNGSGDRGVVICFLLSESMSEDMGLQTRKFVSF